MIVLNLASGPGPQPDEAYFPVLDQLHAAGAAVGGYVDTNYGQRPVYQAMTDLGRYLDWYQVSGVFFDRVAAAADQAGQYADLARAARDMGAHVVAFNHGAHPVEAYAEHADLLGTFEGPWNAYLELAVPRWVRSRAAGQFSTSCTRSRPPPSATPPGSPPAATPATSTSPTAAEPTPGTASPLASLPLNPARRQPRLPDHRPVRGRSAGCGG